MAESDSAAQTNERRATSTVFLEPLDFDRFSNKLKGGVSGVLAAGSTARKTSEAAMARAPATCEFWVIHPHSDKRLAWDMLSFVLLIYNLVVVPFSLCFDVSTSCPESLWFFEAFVDWFFVADIVLNFFTGVFEDEYAQGAVSTDLCVIANRYARTWLLIDVAASLPLEFIVSLSVSGCNAGAQSEDAGANLDMLKLLRGLRMVKLLKLLRLLKLTSMIENLQDSMPVNVAYFKAATMLLFSLYCGHLMACVWYAMGMHNVNHGRSSWLLGDDLVRVVGNTTEIASTIYDRYSASLYFAFTTMTTVGYGDIIPAGPDERMLAILAMTVGVSIFGYIIGSVTTIVANGDAARAQMAAQIERLNMWMCDRQLPRPLQVAIRKYFRYFWSRKTASSDEDQIIANLSSSLRVSLLRFMNREIMELMSIFDVCSDPAFFDIIVQAMRPLCCSAGDIIISEDQVGQEMFFLLQGRMEVLHAGPQRPANEPVRVCELSSGDFFGEIALLTKQSLPGMKAHRRVATVRALTWCEMQTIDKQTVDQCCRDFPEVREHFMQVVRARLAQLRELDANERDAAAPSVMLNAARGAVREFVPVAAAESVPPNLMANIATLQKMQRWRSRGRAASRRLSGAVGDGAAHHDGDGMPLGPSAAGATPDAPELVIEADTSSRASA